MGFIATILELIKSPELYVIIVAFMAALTAIGTVLTKIGDWIPGEDWTDGAVGWISKIVGYIGNVMSWLGMGNSRK